MKFKYFSFVSSLGLVALLQVSCTASDANELTYLFGAAVAVAASRNSTATPPVSTYDPERGDGCYSADYRP